MRSRRWSDEGYGDWGGSTYAPELINGFLSRVDSLPVSELWLMDVSQERLDVVGGFASAHGRRTKGNRLRCA